MGAEIRITTITADTSGRFSKVNEAPAAGIFKHQTYLGRRRPGRTAPGVCRPEGSIILDKLSYFGIYKHPSNNSNAPSYDRL
jgi:hypothetical protein